MSYILVLKGSRKDFLIKMILFIIIQYKFRYKGFEVPMKSRKIIYFLIFVLTSLIFSSIFTSNALAQIKPFDGMYADYIFSFEDVPNEYYNTKFRYSHVSGDLYNVTWFIEGEGISTWIENKETRVISNSTGSFSFDDGSHSKLWIYTNLTVTDSTLITVNGDGDYSFEIIYDINATLFGIGEVEVWVLRNEVLTDSYALYEKSTGLLIYGYFVNSFDTYTLQLTNTNVFLPEEAETPGIPGFSVFIIIPTILITSLIIIRTKKKKSET